MFDISTRTIDGTIKHEFFSINSAITQYSLHAITQFFTVYLSDNFKHENIVHLNSKYSSIINASTDTEFIRNMNTFRKNLKKS